MGRGARGAASVAPSAAARRCQFAPGARRACTFPRLRRRGAYFALRATFLRTASELQTEWRFASYRAALESHIFLILSGKDVVRAPLSTFSERRFSPTGVPAEPVHRRRTEVGSLQAIGLGAKPVQVTAAEAPRGRRVRDVSPRASHSSAAAAWRHVSHGRRRRFPNSPPYRCRRPHWENFKRNG